MTAKPTAQEYPLFLPPAQLAQKSARDWTKKESEIYFRWFLSVLGERLNYALEYFGERSDKDCDCLMDAVGAKFAEKICEEPFSQQCENKRTLSNAGYALSADVGIILATCLLRICGDRIRWTILRKPRRELSYNLPVLTGFHIHLDPIAGLVAEANGIIRGERTGAVLRQAFEFWKSKVKKGSQA